MTDLFCSCCHHRFSETNERHLKLLYCFRWFDKESIHPLLRFSQIYLVTRKNLNDIWLTQYYQIDPNEGLSLLGQGGFRVQCAEVVVPPWNIHYLQRKTLYRQFHGPVFWNQVMNPCSPLRRLGFPLLSALSSTTPEDWLVRFKSSLDALTNSSQLTVSKIANPISLLTTKQTEILGGPQRNVSTDTTVRETYGQGDWVIVLVQHPHSH